MTVSGSTGPSSDPFGRELLRRPAVPKEQRRGRRLESASQQVHVMCVHGERRLAEIINRRPGHSAVEQSRRLRRRIGLSCASVPLMVSGDWSQLWTVAAAAAMIYGGTSFILLKRPSLIHKKKQLRFRCAHISHRGGAGENLENTITAFRHAVRCGTDMLEIDCQLTADNKVVVSHDDNLSRVTGEDVNISDLNYRELPGILPVLALQFNTALTCESHSSDRRIPLLSEIFELFPDLPINIDIKQDNPRLIEEVEQLIVKFQREKLTVWGNFSDSVCQQCYAKNPDIPLYFSVRRVLWLCLWFYIGLLPFIRIKESCLEIAMPRIYIDNPRMLYQPSVRQKFILKLIDKIIMRPCLFKHLQRRGIQIYVWVLNNEEEYARAWSYDIDGIMSDFPSALSAFLHKQTQNRAV